MRPQRAEQCRNQCNGFVAVNAQRNLIEKPNSRQRQGQIGELLPPAGADYSDQHRVKRHDGAIFHQVQMSKFFGTGAIGHRVWENVGWEATTRTAARATRAIARIQNSLVRSRFSGAFIRIYRPQSASAYKREYRSTARSSEKCDTMRCLAKAPLRWPLACLRRHVGDCRSTAPPDRAEERSMPASPTMRRASPTSVAIGIRPALIPSAIALEKPSPNADVEARISAAGRDARYRRASRALRTLSGRRRFCVPSPTMSAGTDGIRAMAARKLGVILHGIDSCHVDDHDGALSEIPSSARICFAHRRVGTKFIGIDAVVDLHEAF